MVYFRRKIERVLMKGYFIVVWVRLRRLIWGGIDYRFIISVLFVVFDFILNFGICLFDWRLCYVVFLGVGFF